MRSVLDAPFISGTSIARQGSFGSLCPGKTVHENRCRGRVWRDSGRFHCSPTRGSAQKGSVVGAFRSYRSGPFQRLRDRAHLAFERARNPTRDDMFRFGAVGISGLVAVIGLLAVLGAARVPWVGGRATNDGVESSDKSVPSLAPQPALGLDAEDPTEPPSEPEGGPSPISLVFPLVGELLNFRGDGGDITRPRSDPRSFSDPQGEPAPDPNTSPNPSPTATNDPSPTTDPDPTTDPTPTTDPVPTTDPTPEPTVEPEPSSGTSPHPTRPPRP